jgi:hypothetical protein
MKGFDGKVSDKRASQFIERVGGLRCDIEMHCDAVVHAE